jgi:hypothetical protein
LQQAQYTRQPRRSSTEFAAGALLVKAYLTAFGLQLTLMQRRKGKKGNQKKTKVEHKEIKCDAGCRLKLI